MIKRMLTVLLLIVFAALLALPVVAQDDEEDGLDMELVDYINEASDGLANFDSYTISGTLTIDQEITAGEITIPSTIVQTITADIVQSDGVTVALDAEISQDIAMGMGMGEGSFVLDMIFVDGAVYVQARDFAGLMATAGLSEGWQQIGIEGSENNPLLDAFGDPDALLASFNEQLTYPLNEETILSLEERRELTIDDDPVRRFAIELDAQSVVDNGGLDSVLSNLEDSASQLGMTSDELIEQLLEGATLGIVVHISTETDRMRRIDSEVVFNSELMAMGEALTLSQTAAGSFVYSNFDEEFGITPPELDS
ncbi:MAG: hypothetical protein ACOCYT_00020 [Chloroflexota bacterium]